jgi:hypothetical protein
MFIKALKMKKFLKKLFVGAESAIEHKLGSAYKQQASHLKAIWHEHTYGLERLFRLSVCLVQFIYPTIFIRSIFGNFGVTTRKVAVEFYIAAKLIFPVFILVSGFYRQPWVIWVIAYLLSETVFHILNLIFLSDVHAILVSYHRSILLLFLNYLEVLFDFAVIYLGLDVLNKPLTPISAVYYSFVTQATLGYGDYHPVTSIGQLVVIFQLVIVILFALLFINYFSARISHKE